MTATIATTGGETVRVTTRSEADSDPTIVLWTKRASVLLTADESRALG